MSVRKPKTHELNAHLQADARPQALPKCGDGGVLKSYVMATANGIGAGNNGLWQTVFAKL